MVCDCRTPSGELSDRCFGTCNRSKLISQIEKNKFDPINEFRKSIVEEVMMSVENYVGQIRLTNAEEQFDRYKKVFLEGIIEGMKVAAINHECDSY